VIMTAMADKGGARTGRERIKTLAQAALNADLTVEQLETVLNTLTSSLAALDNAPAATACADEL